MTLVDRIRKLDLLYLTADSATHAWIRCKDEKMKDALHKRAMQLWQNYYDLKKEQYEHLPMS